MPRDAPDGQGAISVVSINSYDKFVTPNLCLSFFMCVPVLTRVFPASAPPNIIDRCSWTAALAPPPLAVHLVFVTVIMCRGLDSGFPGSRFRTDQYN